MSSIHLTKNQIYHFRTKHIDVRYHWTRDLITNGKTNLIKVYIKDNATNMTTKPIIINKFKYCLDLTNLVRW